MVVSETAYALADESELERVVRALAERFPVARERTLRRRLYYDTFDWRLWRRRSRLWTTATAAGVRLVWQTGSRPLRLELGADPAAAEIGFAADLPAGPFRDRLAKAIGIRRLLPVVDVRAEGHLVRVLDERRKTVVRVFAEVAAARAPGSGGSGKRLDPILRVSPVRGCSRAFEDVAGFLGGELELEQSAADELETGSALGGFGSVGDYTAKPSVVLDPSSDADDAVRQVLRALVETIERNEAGTISSLDTEFLHDFRVAVRRTRSALSQTKRIWQPELIGRYRRGLSWLGGITGPTRDLDVYLLELPGLAAALPEPVRRDLEPFRRLLEAKRASEQGKLASALGGARYRRLIDSWRRFLAARPPEEARPPAARQPIAQLANRVIAKAHRRLLERGRAIVDESPPESLHRLRIDGKKLRYLLELFRSLYPPGEIELLVRALKRLQDNLGAHNDYGVQQRLLRTLGDELGGGAAARTPVGRLLAELERRESEERGRFSERFTRFSSAATTERFRVLLGGGAAG